MPIRRFRSLLAAGKRILTRRPVRVTTLEAAAPGRAWRLIGHPCRRGTVQVHLCLSGDHRACHFQGVVRACSSPDERPRGYGGAVPRQPQAGKWAVQPAPPIVGLGLEAMQGMTNAMNAIANQVIRNLGRSVGIAGWLYFDGTFRDYPAFRRKFESFRANYHRGTQTQELFQQFREMCLPEKIAARIKSA